MEIRLAKQGREKKFKFYQSSKFLLIRALKFSVGHFVKKNHKHLLTSAVFWVLMIAVHEIGFRAERDHDSGLLFKIYCPTTFNPGNKYYLGWIFLVNLRSTDSENSPGLCGHPLTERPGLFCTEGA